jgi:hypothetical protein
MAKKLCPGRFSEETERLLIDEHKGGGGVAFLSQPCATCGLRVVADNKAGSGRHARTYAPSRRAYKSGKRSSK